MDDWDRIQSERIRLESDKLDHEIEMVRKERQLYQGIEYGLYLFLIVFIVGAMLIWLRWMMRI